MAPIALTIAGSDSGGGAGIQADLKTFSALGVYGASVVTAVTAQNTRGVQGVHEVPAEFVVRQIESVLGDLAVGAVKLGMLPGPATIEAVASALERHRVGHVVLDPVMVATSGDRLVSTEAIEVLRRRLMPIAELVTPNLPEAAALLETVVAESEQEMEEQGRRLLAEGARAVIVKGGHAIGPESVDVLVRRSGTMRFAAPRLPTRNTHGTGCTLSAAIAAGLARGLPLEAAIGEAKTYLSDAIAAADRLQVGDGAGPVHHFARWW